MCNHETQDVSKAGGLGVGPWAEFGKPLAVMGVRGLLENKSMLCFDWRGLAGGMTCLP